MNPKLKFNLGHNIVYAKVAFTQEDKQRGYIGSSKIAKDDGILFTKIHEGDGFHMNGVHHPLCIVFLDPKFNVLKTAVMYPYQRSLTYAPMSCEYALEIHPDLRDVCSGIKSMLPDFELSLGAVV